VNSEDHGKAWSNISDFEREKIVLLWGTEGNFVCVFGPQDVAKVKN